MLLWFSRDRLQEYRVSDEIEFVIMTRTDEGIGQRKYAEQQTVMPHLLMRNLVSVFNAITSTPNPNWLQ